MNVHPTLTKNYLEKQYQSHWLAIAAFTKSTLLEPQLNEFQPIMRLLDTAVIQHEE